MRSSPGTPSLTASPVPHTLSTGQILFILVDADEPRNGRIFEYFQITEVNIPSVQILNLSSDARYKMPFESITSQNLKKFGRSYLRRSAKVSLFLKEGISRTSKSPLFPNSAGSVI